MKTLILFLLSCGSLFAQLNISNPFYVAPILKASSAACTTPTAGNELSTEGFQTATTGYERSGWGTATGSPDPYYDISALTTGQPSGSCTRGFRSNYAVSGTFNYNAWDRGAAITTTVYTRMYIYIVSHSISSPHVAYLGGVFKTTMGSGGNVASVVMKNNAGQLEIYGAGSTDSTKVNVSVGQWYRVEMKVVPNGTCEIKVDGGSAATFTATGYTNWDVVGVGTYSTSANAFTFNDTIFDLVGADTTGYMGAP